MKTTLFITIDDAPSQYFEEKLNMLIKYDIPAVFFCEGRKLENYMKKNIKALIDAINSGFVLANHTYFHLPASLTPTNIWTTGVKKTDQLLARIYEKAGQKFNKKFFRYPYGDDGVEWGNGHGLFSKKFAYYSQVLASLGYRAFTPPALRKRELPHFEHNATYWTFDSLDWRMGILGNKNHIITRFHNWCKCIRREEIVLLHDHHPPSNGFSTLIKLIKESGHRCECF